MNSKSFLSYLLLALFGFSLSLYAQEQPADGDIKAALFDIDRYEKQSASLSSKQKVHVKRVLKMLGIPRQRLEKSPNKSHSSWVQADERLKKLTAHLEGLLQDTSPKPDVAPQPRVTGDAALQQTVKQLGKIQNDLNNLKPGEMEKGSQLMEALQETRLTLGKSKSTQDPNYLQAANSFVQLSQAVVQKVNEGQTPKEPSKGLLNLLNSLNQTAQQVKAEAQMDSTSYQTYLQTLEQAESSLMALPNKTHPKWLEGMFLYLNLLNQVNSAFAQSNPSKTVEAIVTKAEGVVSRYETLLANLQPGDVPTANRYLKELKPLGNELNAAKQKSDPKWKAVVLRYNQLNNNIVARANQKANSPNTTEQTDTTTTETSSETSQTSGTSLASYEQNQLNRIKRQVENSLSQIKANPLRTIRSPQDYQNWVRRVQGYRQSLEKLPQSHPEVQGLLVEIQNLEIEVNKAAEGAQKQHNETLLKGLTQKVVTTRMNIQSLPPHALKDPQNVDSWKNSLASLKNQLSQYPDPQNNDVQELLKQVQDLETYLDNTTAANQKTVAELGDYQTRLESIAKKQKEEPLPKPLKMPFTPEQATEYVQTLQRIQKEAISDYEFLDAVYRNVNLPTKGNSAQMGKQDVERLRHWMGRDRLDKAKNLLHRTTQNLKAQAELQSGNLEFYERMDPENPSDQSNYFLGQGQKEKFQKQIQEKIESLKMVLSYNEAVGENNDSLKMALERLQIIQKSYEEKYQQALLHVRMPEAKSQDPKLLALAKEVLENPKHKVNPIERMVINFDLQKREEKRGEVERSTLETKVTIYNYVWEEFQVTTAEKVGEKYFKFVNTLKFYSSGDRQTPLNKWILSDRFQSSEIPKENIAK